MEVEAYGQSLSSEFLDSLFVSIRDKVPEGKWVSITKNHDQVVAGIKHFIDMELYGEPIDIAFNSEFTHFRKWNTANKPSPFEGKYIEEDAWLHQESLKEYELEAAKQRILRERKKEEYLERQKRPKRGRR